MQNEEIKTEITEKLKSRCKLFSVIFAAGALAIFVWGIYLVCTYIKSNKNYPTFIDFLFYPVQHATSAWILAGMLLLAAVTFRRISQSGLPFEEKTIKAVRFIGILCIAEAPCSILIATLISWEPDFAITDLFPLHIIAGGLLLLLAARMMQYGAMLQQESDETF